MLCIYFIMKITGRYILFFFLLFSLFSIAAGELGSVYAYPVPFNPRKNTLTIADRDNQFSGTAINVGVLILDINGDKIFSRSYNQLPVLWRGYSSAGRIVENGLYFIKITVENQDTGEVKQKVIRVLVKQ